MGTLNETNPSHWIVTTPHVPGLAQTALPPGPFDVVVVGAGVAGLSTALLLAEEGAKVCVVEAGPLAAGATGYTTAKVTALQRTTGGEVVERHGADMATAYLRANAAAVEEVVRLVDAYDIACDLERAAACTYATSTDDLGSIEAEHAACSDAGLATRLSDGNDVEPAVGAVGAVWLPDQAQFHPRRFCLGLAASVVGLGGAVVEGVRVLDVDESADGVKVTTSAGEIEAGRVVLTTHLPFLDAGGFFARAAPYRSYALAVRVAGDRVAGMYISAGEPTGSVRSTADGWTIVGGEGHKVGHEEETDQCHARLEAWARSTFDVVEVGARWSAQDLESIDGLPYVGPLLPGRERTWVATAFRKWGMSNGVAAAMLLRDRYLGVESPSGWAEAFDSARLAPGHSTLKTLVKENLDVGKRFVADRIAGVTARDAEELAPGEGEVCKLDGKIAACFRADDGTLHALSADCTHLGCRVSFNTAERTWDCPCHGSRFTTSGAVIEGPALKDLEVVEPG